MSEFRVTVVKLGPISPHPNADRLSVGQVFGYPVVFRTGDFSEGDLVAHIPVDSVVPEEPHWDFLKGHHRIRAAKIRGIFSMGLLTAPPEGSGEGQDVTAALGIVKYEPPADQTMGGDNEPDPGFMPTYTDIEGLRRWPDILYAGESVVWTEKTHGACSRYTYHNNRLWCGSHHGIKREDPKSMWWRLAAKYDLGEVLKAAPGIVFYGEAYGSVQDLKYGAAPGEVKLAFFDAYAIAEGRYLDFEDFVRLTDRLDLPRVPILALGSWDPTLLGDAESELMQLAEGRSTFPGVQHVREGFVVKPMHERWDDRVGRVCLKLAGQQFLLRKGG